MTKTKTTTVEISTPLIVAKINFDCTQGIGNHKANARMIRASVAFTQGHISRDEKMELFTFAYEDA